MTLSDLELLIKIFNDTKRRAVSAAAKLLVISRDGTDAKHNAFSSADYWWLQSPTRREKRRGAWRAPLKRASPFEKAGFISADVHSDVLSPSIDQQLRR